jgi:hypothetical protein
MPPLSNSCLRPSRPAGSGLLPRREAASGGETFLQERPPISQHSLVRSADVCRYGSGRPFAERTFKCRFIVIRPICAAGAKTWDSAPVTWRLASGLDWAAWSAWKTIRRWRWIRPSIGHGLAASKVGRLAIGISNCDVPATAVGSNDPSSLRPPTGNRVVRGPSNFDLKSNEALQRRWLTITRPRPS